MSDDRLPGAYRPIAEHLPGVYQADAASFAQVRGYTQLADAIYRAYLAELDDLTTWLSPDARDVWPPGLPPSASMEAVYAAYGDVFDELARWFAFRFPESWNLSDEEDELDRERHFLLRVPRFWRRRGTPRGFLAWFCFYFKLFTRPERPQLIEHFKYRPAGDTSGTAAGDEDPYAHRITLLVPMSTEFRTFARRRETAEFTQRNAPAHLHIRLCWVAPGYRVNLEDGDAVRDVLTKLGRFTPLEDGIHLVTPPADGTVTDHLTTGRLPGGGHV